MQITNLFQREHNKLKYKAGEYLFREGQDGDSFFVLLEGTVDIMVNGKKLETVEAGGVIGEMTLIEAKPRSADALVRTPATLVSIDSKRFEYLIHNTPFFATHVMRIMAGRLRRMNELTTEAA